MLERQISFLGRRRISLESITATPIARQSYRQYRASTFQRAYTSLSTSRATSRSIGLGLTSKRAMSISKPKIPGAKLEAGKIPAGPRPSSSVLVISPKNYVLLLQRVRTSTTFPSAHVFPGGNIDPKHDGTPPDPQSAERHEDGPTYRLAAVRETFEESGILLAKSSETGRLIEISDKDREKARKAIHSGEVKLADWLASKGAVADTDGLIPFTRWVTPTNVPKRFTTQMYIYFLPLKNGSKNSTASSDISLEGETEAVIPIPTPDGGVEHTAARFLPPWKWTSLARQNRIILFPPQVFLLHLIAQYLSPEGGAKDSAALAKQREELLTFLNDPKTEPSWGQKCISPLVLMMRQSEKRVVLGLNKPSPELDHLNRSGDPERVILVAFGEEGPRDVEVRWKKEVFEEERAYENEQKGKL